MTKWDYMTIVLTGGLMGRHKDEPKHEDLVTQCDALGREAWELTWILINQSLHGEKDDRVLIFMRPCGRVALAYCSYSADE
jgi:hypothetical protein